MRDDDGVEAFRQFNCRYDPVTVSTKSGRLKSIQKCIDKNRAKKNTEVPDLLARFDDLLQASRASYTAQGPQKQLEII